MSRSIPCPPTDELQSFLLGQMAECAAERLHEHLAGCLSCQETVQRVPAEDTLVVAMRSQGRSAARPDEPLVDELIARLDALDPLVAGGDFRFLAPPAAADELGRLGGYRVLKVLGAGGMGIVFEAEDPGLGRRIALKVMKPLLAADPSNRRRFLGEARAAAALHHDHIVTIYQVGEDAGVPFLAMEYLPGETLEDRLVRVGRLDVATTLRLGRQVAEGLDAAHARGLIHRDVKPANIWLESRADGSKRVKILDFGLARAADDPQAERADNRSPHVPRAEAETLTQVGTLVGTPQYMAPEQARGAAIDHRTDLFSLGCVLYRMLAGAAPFGGGSTRAALDAVLHESPRPVTEHSHVPAALAVLLGKLLAKQPDDRPATARAVADTLARIEHRVTNPRARRWGQRLAVAASLAALAIVAPVAMFGLETVERFVEGKGHLTVELDEPDAEVTVNQNGREMAILSGKSGRVKTLPAGDYELALPVGLYGWELETTKLTLGRGRERTIRTTRIPDLPTITDGPPGEVLRIPCYAGSIRGLALFPDDRRLLSISEPNLLKVWELATGRDLYSLRHDARSVQAVAVSPNGRTALSTDQVGKVQVWDLIHAREARVLVEGERVQDVAFSSDGLQALTGAIRGDITLWNTSTWTAERRLRYVDKYDGTNGLWSVSFSADQRRIVAGGGRIVRSWDAATGEPWQGYAGHADGGVWQALFSPDGKLVLTASGDKTAVLFDAESGKVVQRLTGHSKEVRCAAFTPDGTRVLTASLDGTVRIWNVSNGRELHCVRGHDRGITALVVSRDGRFAVTASFDQTIRVWRLPSP